jgi:tetratricopeptide (TPR) repeat protein
MSGFRKSALIVFTIIALAGSWAYSQSEEANKIFGQAGGSVLALLSYGADKAEIAGSKGSGLALSEDVIVTAYHVISQAVFIEGLNIKGKKVKVEGIIGVDKAHDIALLKIKGKAQPLPLGTVDSLAEGARLFAIGSNESSQIVLSEGVLRRIVDLGPDGKVLEISMSIPDQYRGGPLLDVNGQLVGMVLVLEKNNLKVGIPISALVSVTRGAGVAEIKAGAQEKYFETVVGSMFAAKIATAMDDLMSAKMYMERVVKLEPSNQAAQLALADILANQRDYSAAAAAYKTVTELDPSRAEAFYKLGGILMKQVRFKDAAEAMEKAVGLNIADNQIYFELGTAYEELQDFAKAAGAYEKYISLGPAVTWNAYQRLGICRTKLGQFDAAIAALLEAEKGQPKDLKVKLNLAEAYEKAGQLENAESVYSALAGVDPAEAKTYHRQSFRMYDQAKRYDRAVVPAQKVIDLEPKNEMNFYYLGITYHNLQKYDEEVAVFQQVLALKPDFTYAWYQIGSAYIQQKKFREAVAAYKKFTELSPEEPNGWLSLGVCYMQLAAASKNVKENEFALEPLKKCVELKPDSSVAWYNLALVYVNLKDMYSAKEILARLQTLDPGLAEKLKKYVR